MGTFETPALGDGDNGLRTRVTFVGSHWFGHCARWSCWEDHALAAVPHDCVARRAVVLRPPASWRGSWSVTRGHVVEAARWCAMDQNRFDDFRFRVLVQSRFRPFLSLNVCTFSLIGRPTWLASSTAPCLELHVTALFPHARLQCGQWDDWSNSHGSVPNIIDYSFMPNSAPDASDACAAKLFEVLQLEMIWHSPGRNVGVSDEDGRFRNEKSSTLIWICFQVARWCLSLMHGTLHGLEVSGRIFPVMILLCLSP